MAKNVSTIVIVVVAFLGLLVLAGSVFTVSETQRAIVLQLGKPVGGIKGPGLHFKIPFFQNAKFFDYRILEYDAAPADVVTLDKKNLTVDNYARWRIIDPLLFYRTVRVIPSGRARLDDIIYSELRESLGQHTLTDIVSEKRSDIMEAVTAQSNQLLKQYGIKVLDVRIKRADLPQENQVAIYNRMRAERERQAKQYRSEGREAGVRITTQADKERTIMLAEANREAQVLRGEGDAEATKIYAESLGVDPNFYEFTRSLEAYRKGFEKDTRIIITPENDFLKHFN